MSVVVGFVMEERATLIDSARDPAPKVLFQVNRLHGLYTFVWTLARRPWASMPFTGQRFDTVSHRQLLEEFAYLLPFGGSPPGVRTESASPSWNLDRLCAVAAGHASDIDDFQQRLAVWMPREDALRLVSILEKFCPIYDDLVWTPFEPCLRRWQRLLRGYARRHGLEALIGQIARFYATSWNPEVPFHVMLYPAPTCGPYCSTVEFDVVTLSVPDKPCDVARYLAVVTHEVCHSFNECREPRSKDPETMLAGNAEPLAVYGRLALNETLATAIGNGWAARRLTGRLPEGPWYDNWHIETFATALYPLVDEYLEGGRVLDNEFFDRALIAYRGAVGDRMWDYENLFAHVITLTDKAICRQGSVAARLAAHVDYLANAEELDGISEDHLERLLKGKATRLVAFKVGDEASLSELCVRVEWLNQVHFPRDVPFVAGKVGGHDPALFVFSIASLTDLDDALEELKKHWITNGIIAFSPRLRSNFDSAEKPD
jgi:hypothetical protein